MNYNFLMIFTPNYYSCGEGFIEANDLVGLLIVKMIMQKGGFAIVLIYGNRITQNINKENFLSMLAKHI